MTPSGTLRRSLPFCGLPCPPALVTFEADRVHVEGACALCRREAEAARPAGPSIAGKDVPLEQALDRAADLLDRSQRPFVYGLAASPVGTARLAARLAARIDAAIDVEGTDLLEAELEAIAATGQVTATFGELRAAADLVVLWRVDPRATHPQFLPRAMGGAMRRFVIVPADEDASDIPLPPEEGDLVLSIPPGRDLDALQELRGLLNNTPGPSALPSGRLNPHPPGLLEELHDAADAIRSARRAAILWNASLARSDGGSAIAAGFALLTLDARKQPRIAAKAIGTVGNVSGAMTGLLSVTGFPRAVGFSGGAPRHDPDRFGAGRMIDDGGADLVLAFEPVHLDRVLARPTILVGSRRAGSGTGPEVFLPVLPPALFGDGLWLRADGVPLPRPETSASPEDFDTFLQGPGALPTEAAMVAALFDRLRAAA